METKENKVVLFSYFRSSCSWRVRIALNLKNIQYEYRAVHLLKNEQSKPEYTQINPMKSVPTLQIDGHHLAQSAAIIEYLEETRPKPSLLPSDPFYRAKCRQLSAIIGSDTQPIQNVSVLNYVKSSFDLLSQEDKEKKSNEWGRHWIQRGLKAFETEVASGLAGKYSIGDHVTMADLFLIPQLYNARRFGLDLTPFPTILKIEAELNKLSGFIAAHPDNQPDSPSKQPSEKPNNRSDSPSKQPSGKL